MIFFFVTHFLAAAVFLPKALPVFFAITFFLVVAFGLRVTPARGTDLLAGWRFLSTFSLSLDDFEFLRAFARLAFFFLREDDDDEELADEQSFLRGVWDERMRVCERRGDPRLRRLVDLRLGVRRLE
eukprot:GEMP01048797.1.p2 GENE.GEMP01048797.1~~GEMP01048797.1.p2  ORF type:complete len:127 (-),score=28.13 GEMP01048797.1:421-801(-)